MNLDLFQITHPPDEGMGTRRGALSLAKLRTTSMTQEFDDAYKRLKAFLAFYNDNYRDVSFLPHDLRPIPLLEKTEREDPKRAVRNVRTSVNRIVNESLRWGPDKVAKCEAALRANGIISLAELQRYFSKDVKEIVKRGSIDNLTEYYLAKEVVSDTSLVATRKDREKLDAMMSEFEQKEVAKFENDRRTSGKR